MQILLLIIGFIVLIKSAGLLVEGASTLARRLKVSDLAIGLTVVAFGTSLPELFINIIASFQGNMDIAIGNVIGSNIANILLILGVSACIYPLKVTHNTIWREIPFSLLAVFLLLLMSNDILIDGGSVSVLSRIDGFVLLSVFLIFLYYSAIVASSVDGMEGHLPSTDHGLPASIFLMIIGIVGLPFGSQWIVDGAVFIAYAFGMDEATVGLTVVAVGTSLPELATSVVAASRKNPNIAVGNIIGSNLFNILFILGVSSGIRPLVFRMEMNMDIAFMAAVTILLFLFMFTGNRRKLDRWEGCIFILAYISYTIFIIVRN